MIKQLKLMALVSMLCTLSLASAVNPNSAPVIPGAVFPDENVEPAQNNQPDFTPPAAPSVREPEAPAAPAPAIQAPAQPAPVIQQPTQNFQRFQPLPVQTMGPRYNVPAPGIPNRALPTTGPAHLLSLLPVAGFMYLKRRKQQ